ncbi:MAG: phosphotransferase family protein [Anaerolineae bacterium]
MPFSNAQITHAVEQGLRRTATPKALSVAHVTCEDVDWRGLSANTFARCRVTLVEDNKERVVELVIKHWIPGGPTDIVMGIAPLPRESLAFAAGMFGPDRLPSRIDAPFVTALDDPASNEHWLIMRDVSSELTAFNAPAELTEIHRRYSVALDRLALLHATWEKPGPLAQLKKLHWLISDGARLSRGEAVARYVAGLPVSEAELAKFERVKEGIRGARIRPAREAFYKTLPNSDATLWKRHECDRSALIAAFAEFPTTFVHGDFYPSNIGLRAINGENTVVLIDWEWTGNGCGALDVAKLLTEGAALEHADFDSQGLATYYFERYRAHGGTLFDFTTWKHAHELAEVYQALSNHPLAIGWALLDGVAPNIYREARTPRLTDLIAQHLG